MLLGKRKERHTDTYQRRQRRAGPVWIVFIKPRFLSSYNYSKMKKKLLEFSKNGPWPGDEQHDDRRKLETWRSFFFILK